MISPEDQKMIERRAAVRKMADFIWQHPELVDRAIEKRVNECATIGHFLGADEVTEEVRGPICQE